MEKQKDKAARRAQRNAEREHSGVEAIPIEPFEDYLTNTADGSNTPSGSGSPSE
jgi:hypothetical protein